MITLDLNYYSEDDENYHEENNDEDLTHIDGIKYSYDTICVLVKNSKTHIFQSLRHCYKKLDMKSN